MGPRQVPRLPPLKTHHWSNQLLTKVRQQHNLIIGSLTVFLNQSIKESIVRFGNNKYTHYSIYDVGIIISLTIWR